MPATRQTGPNRAAIAAGERPSTATESSHCRSRPAPDDDHLLLDIAAYLRDRRLAPLAMLWLESCRPLTFLGSQALHAASPLVDVFFPQLPLARLASLFEDRTNLDRFLAYLAAGDTGDGSTRSASAGDEPGGVA